MFAKSAAGRVASTAVAPRAARAAPAATKTTKAAKAAKLPPLPRQPRLVDLLRVYNVRNKKFLGQNFLLKKSITDRISTQAVSKTRRGGRVLFVEVGPGPGGLTRSLLEAGAKHLVAVEKDTTVEPLLGQLRDSSAGRFRYVLGDIIDPDQHGLYERIMAEAAVCDVLQRQRAAQVAASDLDTQAEEETATMEPFDQVHIVANLPFGISGELVAMWAQQAAERKYLFSTPDTGMTLMFQKEVCERLAAPLGSKKRGGLSVQCQALFNVTQIMTVEGKCFTPAPKVDAGVAQFIPHRQDKLKGVPFAVFRRLVRAMHHHPNSMVRVALRHNGLDRVVDLLPACGIDPTQRAFMIEIEAYVELARRCIEEGVDLKARPVRRGAKAATADEVDGDDGGEESEAGGEDSGAGVKSAARAV
ncbi:hypothetical protein HK105_205791 [Polyrhizophydium stewartii]|uniref:rRNA adenine N(6)-methyltransferase n=1 Tax=Polyrhizophydium stewartii TaxID=2732419 RepID=A0ABR4N539_9FUNG|nr:Dimethyladenosine transferase 1, mitochondrial [Polyrhizophydium stewartii]